MTELFKKLNFKGQESVHIINAPDEFISEMKAIQPFTKVKTSVDGDIHFLLFFASNKAAVEQGAAIVADCVKNDDTVWFAYPKGTSKKYKSDISRDHGWEALFALGYDTVRSVAIDADWTGLRFRKHAFIKKLAK